MAYYLSPIGNTQIIDANGDPLVGGTISTFLSGTSTAATTYTDDTGGTAQGVVMTLNSLGYPTNGPVWILGGVPLKFIIKNAAGVTQSTFDDISGIGDTATGQDQWVLYGAAPTYIGATSFSVTGDQTNTFQVGRRVKTTNSGGTVYSTISASAYGALTTVTVINDGAGVLDSGLSQVNLGLITAVNTSLPRIGPTVQVITATGTYTKPAGVRRIRVRVVGGGGEGGGITAANRSAGGGGGGGYAEEVIDAVAITTVAVTIGAGGAAGGTGAGATGGTTSFGAYLQATGGVGGTASGTVIGASSGGAGGIGSGGDINASGGPGSPNAGLTSGGNGGASALGGGAAVINNAGGGATGQPYGGGGAGAGNNIAASGGGAGAAGVCIVDEFY